MQSIPFADPPLVPPFIHGRAVRLGGAGGIVSGAVVRDDKHLIAFPRIVLRLQAVEQLPDHRFLMPGAHDHGKAVPARHRQVLAAACRRKAAKGNRHMPDEDRKRQKPRGSGQGVEQDAPARHMDPLPHAAFIKLV